MRQAQPGNRWTLSVDAVAARRDASGGLPTATEFAAAIVRATDEPHDNGDTIYVGGADYLS